MSTVASQRSPEGDAAERLPVAALIGETLTAPAGRASIAAGSDGLATDSDELADTQAQGAAMFPPVEPLRRPRRSHGEAPLSTYELGEPLGRGGMGQVCRARQLSLGREVAVKQLRADRATAATRAKFVAEARLTGALDHPNIVPVYDLFSTPFGEPVLSMKRISGVEWRALLRDIEAPGSLGRQLDQVDHLRLLITVCQAVSFAHSRGIAHCDIKPENVMVGDFGEVVLMDWGGALDFRDAEQRSARPMPALPAVELRGLTGTPCYMPPELAHGRGGEVGPHSDVYLLGGMLYEILTGRAPHQAGSLWQVLMLATKGRVESPADAVMPELRALCMRALEPRIEDRYTSVAEFREALEAYLSHRESLLVLSRASLVLDSCLASAKDRGSWEKGRDELYADFADAVAGFRQAFTL